MGFLTGVVLVLGFVVLVVWVGCLFGTCLFDVYCGFYGSGVFGLWICLRVSIVAVAVGAVGL